METAETKRKRVEEAVDSHPQFKRVAEFIAKKYGKDISETKQKFIDFLVKENYYTNEGVPHNVLCFEYNDEKQAFINRTLFVSTAYPT